MFSWKCHFIEWKCRKWEEQKTREQSFSFQLILGVIYRKYDKNDLHAITSQLKGHLLLLGNKNPDVHLGRIGGLERKNHEFHFRLELT